MSRSMTCRRVNLLERVACCRLCTYSTRSISSRQEIILGRELVFQNPNHDCALAQVKAMESELIRRAEEQGLDVCPQIIVVTRWVSVATQKIPRDWHVITLFCYSGAGLFPSLRGLPAIKESKGSRIRSRLAS